MVYETLQVNFELNSNNEYQLKNIKIKNKFYDLISLLFTIESETDATFYVDDLDKFYIYLIKLLLKNGYKNTIEDLKIHTFSYVYKGGKCSNIKIKNI